MFNLDQRAMGSTVDGNAIPAHRAGPALSQHHEIVRGGSRVKVGGRI
jgi:hypothetical protein